LDRRDPVGHDGPVEYRPIGGKSKRRKNRGPGFKLSQEARPLGHSSTLLDAREIPLLK